MKGIKMNKLLNQLLESGGYNLLPELVSTAKAGEIIGRSSQTLRKWHCLGTAPMGIRPIKINGRLSWRVSDLKKLVEGGS